MSGLIAGTALTVGKGIYDEIESSRAAKKAKGLMPPLEDSESRQHLLYLDNKRKAIASGSMYGRQAAEIGSELADTQAGIVSASGGAAGAAITGLNRAQRGAGNAYGQVVGEGMKMELPYEQMYGNVLDQITQRKADLQLNQYEQAMAESARLKKSGDEEIMGGIARALPVTPDLGKLGTDSLIAEIEKRKKGVVSTGGNLSTPATPSSPSGYQPPLQEANTDY